MKEGCQAYEGSVPWGGIRHCWTALHAKLFSTAEKLCVIGSDKSAQNDMMISKWP